jgi:hypothetical protein
MRLSPTLLLVPAFAASLVAQAQTSVTEDGRPVPVAMSIEVNVRIADQL